MATYPNISLLIMFIKPELLDSVNHRKLKVKPISNFSFAKTQRHAPISHTEMLVASREYVIVFPKASDQPKEVLPVVLLGLQQNQFVNAEGQWIGRYVPAHFRRYPFVLGNTDQRDAFNVLLDRESEFVSSTEGEALFDDQGEQTERLRSIVDFLTLFQREALFTTHFVETLRSAGVLMEQQIQQQSDGQNHVALVGFEVVDAQKLDALDDAQFIQWRKQGLLPLIYAHLASLQNIHQLV